MSFAAGILFALLIFGSYLLTPAVLIWGWIRWTHGSKLGVFAILSLLGFLFATASALWALGTVIEGGLHPFQFYDPRLISRFRIGFLLSLIGLLFGLCGVWRKTTLQWHAPCAAIGTFLFWLFAAAAE